MQLASHHQTKLYEYLAARSNMRYISEGTLREVIFHVRLLDLSSCLLFSRFSYFLPLSLATSPPSFPRLLLCIVADPGMGLYREP